jgi:murein tripeptide amidase MpaA
LYTLNGASPLLINQSEWDKIVKLNNKFQHLVFASFNGDGCNENLVATEQQSQATPTLTMTFPTTTPPTTTQGSPKDVVEANT